MSIESNKEAMNKFVEFINTGSEEMAKEIISPNVVFHVPGNPEPMQGIAGYMQILGMMKNGFPDVQWTLQDIIAEKDSVAARFIMTGTHSGNFMGVPPSGRTIQIQAMNFYFFSNGKIVKEYGQPDFLGLMMQIGAIPPPR